MKKVMTVILATLFIGCLGVSFLTGDAFAAEVDYGFEIFGQEVTSSYSSNSTQGWSYDASTNTLTLDAGSKLTYAYVDFFGKRRYHQSKKVCSEMLRTEAERRELLCGCHQFEGYKRHYHQCSRLDHNR